MYVVADYIYIMVQLLARKCDHANKHVGISLFGRMMKLYAQKAFIAKVISSVTIVINPPARRTQFAPFLRIQIHLLSRSRLPALEFMHRDIFADFRLGDDLLV